MSIGVPIKVLHEAEGHIVTLETISGALPARMLCLPLQYTSHCRRGVSRQARRGRGQYELSDGRHHSDAPVRAWSILVSVHLKCSSPLQRRPSIAAGERVHSRQQDPLLDIA